jgi:hypothetical protein
MSPVLARIGPTDTSAIWPLSGAKRTSASGSSNAICLGKRWLPQTTCADCAGSSGDLPPPSPPAEKATTCEDQTRQSCTGDGARDSSRSEIVSNRAGKSIRAAYCVIQGTWPAPGSEDTLGVLMEPEVGHGATEVYARVQARGCAADQGTRRVVYEQPQSSARAALRRTLAFKTNGAQASTQWTPLREAQRLDELLVSKCDRPHTSRPIPELFYRAWIDGPSIWNGLNAGDKT